MQIKVAAYETLEQALVSVRAKVDEFPNYHGTLISYTILQNLGKVAVYLNRRPNGRKNQTSS